MKFQPDTASGGNLITRHEPGRIFVGSSAHNGAVIVPWAGDVLPWPVAGFESLEARHFTQLAALKPELVIFGTGSHIRFVHTSLLADLINAGIGVESMDTAAACRTYNVLVSELRSVVAALLVSS